MHQLKFVPATSERGWAVEDEAGREVIKEGVAVSRQVAMELTEKVLGNNMLCASGPVKIWQAHKGNGCNDGLKGEVISWHSTEQAARKAAEGRGDWGSNGGATEAYAIFFAGNVYLLAREEPIDLNEKKAKADAALRQATISALTQDQRRVLGIS
jgi:hypothetical protein